MSHVIQCALLRYSEGGYNAIAASAAFDEFGIKPLHVFAGGPPIKTGSWLILGLFQNDALGNTNIFSHLCAALVALSLSSTRPGVANYNTGQDGLAGDVDLWQALFQDDGAPSTVLSPVSYLDYIFTNYAQVVNLDNYLSPIVTDLFQNALEEGDTDPCDEPTIGVNDKLCEALLENDLTDIVLNAKYDIDICHSFEDYLVVIENVPEGHLKYNVTGGHGEASVTCSMKLFAGVTLEKPKIRKAKSAKGAKNSKKGKKTRG